MLHSIQVARPCHQLVRKPSPLFMEIAENRVRS